MIQALRPLLLHRSLDGDFAYRLRAQSIVFVNGGMSAATKSSKAYSKVFALVKELGLMTDLPP